MRGERSRTAPTAVVAASCMVWLAAGCFIFEPGPEIPGGIDSAHPNDGGVDIHFDVNNFDEGNDVHLDATYPVDSAIPAGTVCAPDEIRCNSGAPERCSDDLVSWVGIDGCYEGEICRHHQGCIALPVSHEDFCITADAHCADDFVCYLGLCLTHEPNLAENGSCFSDEECSDGFFCNGFGTCTEGSGADTCLSDSDCRGQTPLCNPHRVCSEGDVDSSCFRDYGCLDGLICGLDDRCQFGNEGDGCVPGQGHCNTTAPICSSYGTCQTGDTGDACASGEDCAYFAPSCRDGQCSQPDEMVACGSGGTCGPGAPFCGSDGFCHNGGFSDPCILDNDCVSMLLCGPGDADEGYCQLGSEGDPCIDEEDCNEEWAPICFRNAGIGVCQDGGPDDDCRNEEDCSSTAPICTHTGNCSEGLHGDRCQIPEDCISELVCLVPNGSEFGRCAGGEGDHCSDDSDCGTGAANCVEEYNSCESSSYGSLCDDENDCTGPGLSCTENRCLLGTDDDPCLNHDDCASDQNYVCGSNMRCELET